MLAVSELATANRTGVACNNARVPQFINENIVLVSPVVVRGIHGSELRSRELICARVERRSGANHFALLVVERLALHALKRRLTPTTPCVDDPIRMVEPNPKSGMAIWHGWIPVKIEVNLQQSPTLPVRSDALEAEVVKREALNEPGHGCSDDAFPRHGVVHRR